MVIIILLVLLAGSVVAAVLSLNALIHTLRFGLPFVTTPAWAVRWLSDNLRLAPSDIVYELGCGDTRVLAALAARYPEATFVGIEIQWWPYMLARWRTRNLPNVRIILGDFLRHDLSSATVVYGFFITAIMPKVAIKLKVDLRVGTSVISFGFALPGWQPVKAISNPDRPRGSRILFYRA